MDDENTPEQTPRRKRLLRRLRKITQAKLADAVLVALRS